MTNNTASQVEYGKCSECGRDEIAFALDSGGRCYWCAGTLVVVDGRTKEEVK